MITIRKSKERVWKEKLETLEEVLKEFNNESVTLTIKHDILSDSSYVSRVTNRGIFWPTKEKIACLRYNERLIIKATEKEHIPLLKEICNLYERKTLKDEPIIEY